jgi:hypothetical protein
VKDLADEPLLAFDRGRLDLEQVLAIMPQEPQGAFIAMDDEQLTDADLAVEGHFILGVISRALDLNEEIRTAKEVCAAIDGSAVVQDNDDVGNAVIVFPPFATVADVGARIFFSTPCALDNLREDVAEIVHYLLMCVGWHGRHDVHSLPDLIVEIDAQALPLLNQIFGCAAVQHQ